MPPPSTPWLAIMLALILCASTVSGKDCGPFTPGECGDSDPLCSCDSKHAQLWQTNPLDAADVCHACVQCCKFVFPPACIRANELGCANGLALKYFGLGHASNPCKKNEYYATCMKDCECTTCTPGEYVLSEPDLYIDRTCKKCNSRAAYSTTNNAKQCTDQVQCAPGQYIEYPTSLTTSKGVCKPCLPGTSVNDVDHRKQTCADHKPCDKGTKYVRNDGTKLKSCSTCDANTYRDQDEHFEKECKPQAMCGKGTYITGTSATAKAVRRCVPCEPNTYQDSEEPHRIEQCKMQVTCGKGTFISADSKDEPRTCQPCPPNSYQNSDAHQSTICKPQTECGAGERIEAATTAAKAEGQLRCINCDADEYQDAVLHRSTTCIKHDPCPAGTLFFGSTKVKGGCVGCGNGTYQDQRGHLNTACTPQTVCSVGEQITAGSTIAKQQCSECAPQTFQNETEHRLETCNDQTTCGKGYFISPDSRSSARGCSLCPEHSFLPDSNHRLPNCTAQPTCAAGERISNDTKVSARNCTPCSLHSYQNQTSHRNTTCTEQPQCDAGYFYVKPGGLSMNMVAVCKRCPARLHQNASSHRLESCEGGDAGDAGGAGGAGGAGLDAGTVVAIGGDGGDLGNSAAAGADHDGGDGNAGSSGSGDIIGGVVGGLVVLACLVFVGIRCRINEGNARVVKGLASKSAIPRRTTAPGTTDGHADAGVLYADMAEFEEDGDMIQQASSQTNVLYTAVEQRQQNTDGVLYADMGDAENEALSHAATATNVLYTAVDCEDGGVLYADMGDVDGFASSNTVFYTGVDI